MALQDDDVSPGGFRYYWFSTIGQSAADDMTRTLLPILAVATVGATPFLVGALQALGMLPFLLFSIPVGTYIGAYRPKALMLSTDMLRFALVGTIPIAAIWGSLTIGHLLLVVALVGILDVLFSNSAGVALPRLVASTKLDSAFSRIRSAQTATAIVAPAIASGVTALFSPSVAAAVGACGFALSFAALLFVRMPASAAAGDTPEPVKRNRLSMASGFIAISHNRLLRNLFSVNLLWCASSGCANAVLVVYALATLHMSAGEFAFIASLEAFAAFAATLVAGRLTRATGIGRIKMVTSIAQTGILIGFPTIPLLPGPHAWWFAALGVISAFVSVVNSLAAAGTVTRAAAPGRLAEVLSTSRLTSVGVMPLFILGAGAVAQVCGVQAAIWVAAALMLAATLVFLRSPMLAWRTSPSDEDLQVWNKAENHNSARSAY